LKKIIYILGVLFITLFSYSQHSVNKSIPPRPEPPKLVNDFTGTLTPAQAAALENKLVAFDKRSSTQIAVVVVQSTGVYDISEYALAILRNWGIGQKKQNNGALLLIAIKDRNLDINTGYGLEGSLDNLTSKYIIEEDIKPRFKEGKYYEGISAGIDRMLQTVDGQFTAPEGYGEPGISKGKLIIISILFLLFFMFLISKGSNGGGAYLSRRGFRGWGGGNIFWFGGDGGNWGGGGSGGGGGFGGFGGGSGGGGGASGSW
jgi:uncharacterized protein